MLRPISEIDESDSVICSSVGRATAVIKRMLCVYV